MAESCLGRPAHHAGPPVKWDVARHNIPRSREGIYTYADKNNSIGNCLFLCLLSFFFLYRSTYIAGPICYLAYQAGRFLHTERCKKHVPMLGAFSLDPRSNTNLATLGSCKPNISPKARNSKETYPGWRAGGAGRSGTVFSPAVVAFDALLVYNYPKLVN